MWPLRHIRSRARRARAGKIRSGSLGDSIPSEPCGEDTFSRKEGCTHLGATAEVACDHYHLYQEDVRLMAELGVKAYRFSISWSRVLHGDEVSEATMAFMKKA